MNSVPSRRDATWPQPAERLVASPDTHERDFAPAEDRDEGVASSSAAARFFLGAGLPIFLLAAALVYEAFLLALVFAPSGNGWWGDFAQQFRVWCFQYDPRTGGMDWASVGMMLLEPLFVLGAALLLWRRVLPAWRAVRKWTRHWRAAVAGALVALGASGSLFALGRPTADALPPFPGERIRTHLVVPAYTFVDQTGRAFSLSDLRGQVVLVTGVYATCSVSCPQILRDTRTLLEGLPAEARAHLRVVALSLNPEYETTEMMAGVARGYGFAHPEFRYVSGDIATMHDALERLQFSRVRNPRTGIIEHANLMLLVDAKGEIAYRFNADTRHAAWLREAILSLTKESLSAL